MCDDIVARVPPCRVLFCGDKSTSASDVGRCVIAACALMSPTLSCVFRRAFPYACLTQLDFLSQPGYGASLLCIARHIEEKRLS